MTKGYLWKRIAYMLTFIFIFFIDTRNTDISVTRNFHNISSSLNFIVHIMYVY